MGVNIVPHYHLFFTDSHIRRCNDGGLVPEEEGGGEEAGSKGCRPPVLQEVHLPLHQEAGTLCTSWSCCRRGFTPASTPSPPPFSSAKGWGQVDRSKTSEALHRRTLGQSQIMEDSKHEPRKSQLSESSADQ